MTKDIRKLPANKTDDWLRLVSLPFRAYIVCAPVVVFSLSCALLPSPDKLDTFVLSVANIAWADIGCLFVLSGIAWVAFVINARKMFEMTLVYMVIGVVLGLVLLAPLYPANTASRHVSLRFRGISECAILKKNYDYLYITRYGLLFNQTVRISTKTLFRDGHA